MGRKEDMPTQAALIDALRSGLMQLDDLSALRRNPLLPLLCRPGDGALALQRTLVAAIAEVALSDDPFAADAHEILYYRYVERLTQQQLAYQLGVSVRHLRRLQENALELLAARLSQRLEQAPSSAEAVTPDATHGAANLPPAVADEIAWLRTGMGDEVADLVDAVSHALQDVAVVAGHLQVQVIAPPPLPPTPVTVPPPVLRQALLTALAWAVTAGAANGVEQVPLHWLVSAHEAGLTLTAPGPGADTDVGRELEVAGQILASFGGSIAWDMAHGRVEMRAPRVGGVPVLVVDDNPDARRLFQRYLAQSRYRAITAEGGDDVLALVQGHQVRAVVLDIMMPGVDGWTLLAQLQHHPATQAVPVVICTILPQRQLAQLLGAATFLPKPVSQPDLLATLGQLTGLGVKAPG